MPYKEDNECGSMLGKCFMLFGNFFLFRRQFAVTIHKKLVIFGDKVIMANFRWELRVDNYKKMILENCSCIKSNKTY